MHFRQKTEEHRISYARRRARDRGLRADLTAREWRRAVTYFRSRCAFCGARFVDVQMTLDHYIPLADPACPGTTAANVIPTCEACNVERGRRLPGGWLVERFGDEEGARIAAQIAEFINYTLEQQARELARKEVQGVEIG